MSEASEFEARALRFLEERGSELDRLRAAAIAGEGAGPILEALAVAQGLDGAFRFAEVSAGDAVAGTLHALSILSGAGLAGADAAARAVTWLETQRQPDASWGIAAGGEHAQHLATGFLAGFLAQSPFARGRVLQEAGDWLAARWSPELVQGGDFAMLAAHAHFFANYPHDESDPILQWCGRELERGVRGGRLPALFAVRVFLLCEAPVFPGTRLDAPSLLAALSQEQASDGGWLPGAAPTWRVVATLVGLEAFHRFAHARRSTGGP